MQKAPDIFLNTKERYNTHNLFLLSTKAKV